MSNIMVQELSNPEETRRICIHQYCSYQKDSDAYRSRKLTDLNSSWHLQTILNLFAIKIYINLAPQVLDP
jgi:hypothetical protein